MAEYERAGQILPENGINSKISKSLVFDLPCESTELQHAKLRLRYQRYVLTEPFWNNAAHI